MGFRVDQLEEVYTEVLNLFKTYSQNPIFGVDVTFEDVEQNIDEVTVPKGEDNLELIDTNYGMFTPVSNNRNNYKVDGGS